jgi:hypothetical protein
MMGSRMAMGSRDIVDWQSDSDALLSGLLHEHISVNQKLLAGNALGGLVFEYMRRTS